MLFDAEKLNRFLKLLKWSKTSVMPHSSSLKNTTQVADGVLIYGKVRADIKIYTCDDIVFQDKMSAIWYQGDFLTLMFDVQYFDKLIESKFKSAFFGACAIQVMRYILHEVKRLPEFTDMMSREPICLPSHKPEIAEFFHRKNKRLLYRSKRTFTAYENFIAQALLRGGYDIREFAVDKEALRFVPIDDVLSAHAVDVEMRENVFLSAERINRIRALHHFYETDLTQWDGSELQIDLL